MRIGAMAARKAGARLQRNALTSAFAIMVVCPVNAQAPTAHTRSTNRALQRPDAGMQGRPKPPAPPRRQWEALNAQGVEAYRAGDYSNGTKLAEEALGLARKAFGDRDPRTLSSLNNLALLYKSQGRYGEAEPFYREALQARREVLGPRHPNTLTSLNNLAFLYNSQGRYGEAEPLFREALQARREVLGPRHPDTLGIQLSMAVLLVNQSQGLEAVRLLQQMEPQVLGWIGQELYSTSADAVRRQLVSSQATFQNVVLSLAAT